MRARLPARDRRGHPGGGRPSGGVRRWRWWARWRRPSSTCRARWWRRRSGVTSAASPRRRRTDAWPRSSWPSPTCRDAIRPRSGAATSGSSARAWPMPTSTSARTSRSSPARSTAPAGHDGLPGAAGKPAREDRADGGPHRAPGVGPAPAAVRAAAMRAARSGEDGSGVGHGPGVPRAPGHHRGDLRAARRRAAARGAGPSGSSTCRAGPTTSCPASTEGAMLAIADKIDTVVGCLGVGLVPTGSQDPYALRRQAQGIVQIALPAPISPCRFDRSRRSSPGSAGREADGVARGHAGAGPGVPPEPGWPR